MQIQQKNPNKKKILLIYLILLRKIFLKINLSMKILKLKSPLQEYKLSNYQFQLHQIEFIKDHS